MAKKAVVLPKVMSELIKIALADLEAVEGMDSYYVEMHSWHEPDGGKCAVCLAGSVMARTLKASTKEELFPKHFHENRDQLDAIDSLRQGQVSIAMAELGISPPSLDRDIVDYHKDPELFKAQMRELAADLEARGL